MRGPPGEGWGPLSAAAGDRGELRSAGVAGALTDGPAPGRVVGLGGGMDLGLGGGGPLVEAGFSSGRCMGSIAGPPSAPVKASRYVGGGDRDGGRCTGSGGLPPSAPVSVIASWYVGGASSSEGGRISIE